MSEWLNNYSTHSYIDSKDTTKTWCACIILNIDYNTKNLKIHYEGWGTKFDRTLSFSSSLIAPFRKHSILYTGQKDLAIRDWVFSKSELFEVKSILKSLPKYAFDLTQFIRGRLFTLVDCLLVTEYMDLENLKDVVSFLQDVLDFIKDWIRDSQMCIKDYYENLNNDDGVFDNWNYAYYAAWPEVIFTLKRLFGLDLRTGKQLVTWKIVPENYVFSLNTKNLPTTIGFFVNYFAKIGGFDRILDVLKYGNEDFDEGKSIYKTPLKIISSLPVFYMKEYFHKDFYRSWTKEFKDLIIKRIENINNQELKILENGTIAKTLEKLKIMIGDEENFEVFELDFALKQIKSPYMEKRIKGVAKIIDTIENNPKVNTHDRNIDPDFLSQWIIKNHVIENIIENPHEEIIKRIASIFFFLINRKTLIKDHILLLWEMTKHPTLEQSVYTVVLQITNLMPYDIKIIIYQKALERNLNDITEEYIRFLCDFSIKATNYENEEFYALDYLFDLCIAHKSKSFHNTLIGSFIDILKHSRSFEKVYFFTSICLDNFYSNTNFCQTILVYLKIIDEATNSFKSPTNLEGLNQILYLGIPKLNELFIKNCSGILSGEVKTPFSPGRSAKICLKMWRFITKRSPSVIKTEQIKAFWDLAYANPTRKVYEKYMKALLKMVKSIFSSDLNGEIFQNLFLRNKDLLENIDKESFKVFFELFFQVNHHRKYLEISLNGFYSRNSYLLIGLNSLFTIFFSSTDPKIIKKASPLLLKAITKLHKQLLNKKIDIWDDFLSTLKLQISTNSHNKIHKALNLLYDFIDLNNKDNNNIPNAKIKFKQPHEQDYNIIHVYDKSSIKIIRKKIADFYCCDIEYVSFKSYNDEIYDYLADDEVLGMVKMPWNFTVIIMGQGKLEMLSPYAFLCRSEEFMGFLLEKMNEFDKESGLLAWKIVRKCADLKEIKEWVLNFKKPFEEVFDCKCLYELIYNMQIAEEGIKDSAWMKMFIEKKGKEALVRVLLQNNIKGIYSDEMVVEFHDKVLAIISGTNKVEKILPYEIVNKILDCLVHAGNTLSQNSDPYKIVSSAKIIISDFKDQHPEQYFEILSNYPITELLRVSLIKCSCKHFSSNMSSFFLEQSNAINDTNVLFFDGLLSIFDEVVNIGCNEHYWGLMSFFIEKICVTDRLSEKYLSFINILRNHPAENSFKEPDLTLIGIIKVLRVVISKLQFVTIETIDLILQACLFCIPSEQSKLSAKCKSTQARKNAFDLLNTICHTSQNSLTYVLNYLSSHYKNPILRSNKLSHWSLSLNQPIKSTHVLIKNKNSISHLICIIYQLFSIEPFQDFILKLPTNSDNLENPDLLFQLQHLFTILKTSDKHFTSAKGIIKSFNNWEKGSINLSDIEDADEFLSTFMDRLDCLIQPLSDKNIVKDHFTGYLVTEIQGKDQCAHISEISEPFITLSLPIKKVKNLFESLEGMSQSEVLDGLNSYQCDRCGNKTPALRRVSIKYLPNILFITLQRFEYNYDTMKRIKLFDSCDFPMDLDMTSFTQETINHNNCEKETVLANEIYNKKYPDDYYKYSLKGIIIHSGTADSGYYYSLIKDNGLWHEFNDKTVTSLSADEVFNTFSGSGQNKFSDLSRRSSMSTSSTFMKPKVRNSYILVYEKSQLFTYNKDQETISPWDCRIIGKDKNFIEILYKNRKFWHKKLIFSPEYFDFTLLLLSEKILEISKFGICIFLTAIIRSDDYSRIASCIMSIKEHLHKNKILSIWLLGLFSHKKIVREFFMDCPVLEKRRLIVGLAITAFCQIPSDEKETFFKRVLGFLPLARPPKSFYYTQYFELIFRCLKHYGELILLFEVHQRLLEYINDQNIQIDKSVLAENDRNDIVDYGVYIRKKRESDLSVHENGNKFTYLAMSLILCYQVYEIYEIEIFLSEKVMSLLLRDAENKLSGQAVGKLYGKICTNNKAYTIRYGKFLLDCLERAPFGLHKVYMRPFFCLLKCLDNHYSEKINFLLSGYYKLLKLKSMFFLELESYLHFLYKLVMILPKVKEWAKKKAKKMKKIKKHLESLKVNTQILIEDLETIKKCLSFIEKIEKAMKNKGKKAENFEDSDNDGVEEKVRNGNEVFYYSSEHGGWIRCLVMINLGELICVKNEDEKFIKWVDSNSEDLKKVVRRI